MNRFVCTSLYPAAAVAGMLLVHCSSSTTTNSSSGTTSTHASGSSSTSATSGTTTGATTGTTATTASTETTASTATTITSKSAASTSTGPLTDTHDAGPCIGPDGGSACDPGNIECNNAQCDVAHNECCNPSTGSPVCTPTGTACTGSPQACDEKSDCPDGQICCLNVTNINGDFTISCQTGTTCPSPSGSFASAQICKTNAECSTGACSNYVCNGQTTEACQAPSPIDCTKE